jgi:hypothetical protein
VFRGTKVQWSPALEADTTNPIYGLNLGEFKITILRGRWLKETVIGRLPGQHNVRGVFVDSSLEFICYNRRRQFVLSNGTTMPD